MISYIKGRILEKALTYIILENQGVGYKVFVTPDALQKAVGDEASFYTYHKVAEDGQALFGLPNFSTLQFFELLITILSAAPVESVKQAIASQDAGAFKRISGIGTKTAEKIIVELKSKVGAMVGEGSSVSSSEVFDALLALGYKQNVVREVINKIDSTKPQDQQLKQALQMLGKK